MKNKPLCNSTERRASIGVLPPAASGAATLKAASKAVLPMSQLVFLTGSGSWRQH